jgi:tryptophan synthase alpha chain
MPLEFKLRPALIVYLTCGDPDIATTRAAALAALRAGADIIELGVPFSDPVADGPTIQRAMERALRGGTTLQQVLELARELRAEAPRAGIILFSYFNPILRFGLERFCATVKNAGADGALITDLTIEEAGDYLRAMRAHHLATVFLAAPTSTAARLKRIAQAARGFIYVVSRTGVTGTQEELTHDARDVVRRLRKFTDLPLAVGFGISNAAQFAAVGEFADAGVVGSAFVELIAQSASPAEAGRGVAQFTQALVAVSRRQKPQAAR